LSGPPIYQQASPFRRAIIESFCEGVAKFRVPFKLAPSAEAIYDRFIK
jgi:hypothetical protein